MTAGTTAGVRRVAACWLLLAAVVAGGTLLLGAHADGRPRDAVDVAALLPPDTVAHVMIDGGPCRSGARELGLARLLRDPEMRAFLAPSERQVRALEARTDAWLREHLEIPLADLLALLQGRWTITLVDPERGPREVPRDGPDLRLPDLVVTCAYEPALDAARRALIAFEELFLAPDLGTFHDHVLAGVRVKHFAGQRLPFDLYYTVHDGLFLLGTRAATFEGVLERLKGGGAASLATTRAWRAWRRDGGFSGETGRAFLRLAPLVAWLQAHADPRGPALAARLAGTEVTHAGLSIVLEGRGVRESVWVRTAGSGKGGTGSIDSARALASPVLAGGRRLFVSLWHAPDSGEQSGLLDLLRRLPAAHALESRLHAAARDLLGPAGVQRLESALGPELALVVSRGGAGLVPEILLVREVSDPALLRGVFSEGAGGTVPRPGLRSEKVGGAPLWWAEVPWDPGWKWAPFGPRMRPSWSVVDDQLVFGLWPRALQGVLGATPGERPGTATLSAACERVLARGPRGGRLVSLTGLDLPGLLAGLLGSAEPLLQAVELAPFLDPLALPGTDLPGRTLDGVAVATWRLEQGWRVDAWSPVGTLVPVVLVLAHFRPLIVGG